jgi:hypothetical protein
MYVKDQLYLWMHLLAKRLFHFIHFLRSLNFLVTRSFCLYGSPSQMAVIVQLVLVFFAAQYFRERHYRLFRATHCLYPLIFFSSVTHRFTCFWYFLPGMILIMSDIGQRLTSKVYSSTAELTPTGDRCTFVNDRDLLWYNNIRKRFDPIMHFLVHVLFLLPCS